MRKTLLASFLFSQNRLLLYFLGLFLTVSGPLCSAQTEIPIKFDQEMSGTLSPDNPVAVYSFTASRGQFVESTLDLPQRDFSIKMSMLNVINVVVDENEGRNYPSFPGAYMYTEIPLDGTYYIRIEASGIQNPVNYTFVIRTYTGDENTLTIALYNNRSGIIAPGGDQDAFLISMRQGSPYLITVATPRQILNSVVGIFDPDNNLVAYNDDFFGTGSSLLFIPPTDGPYAIVVAGSSPDDIGPYTLVVNGVPLFDVPFSNVDEIVIPGEALVYEIQLQQSQVYDFRVVGVDNFRAYIALTDKNMNVIASTGPAGDTPLTILPGFTPLRDESLYLFIMGTPYDALGSFGFETVIRPKETEVVRLNPGDAVTGVIGPVGDKDEYVFTAEAGKRYSILVTPTLYYLDPAVRVLDQTGKEVFYNDDSADGVFAILSGITLPQPGDYRIQVLASPVQGNQLLQTGVYAIQLAEGATFDRGAPRIYDSEILVTPIAGGAHISFPTTAIADDTYPLSATLTYDHRDQKTVFQFQKDRPVELDLPSDPDEIFFLSTSDSADAHNTSPTVTLPPPAVIATLENPYALAVDAKNNLYIADANLGAVIRVTPAGATETIVADLETGGGTLGPNALAFDKDGNLYLSNGRTHSILKILPDGTTKTVVENLNYPIGLAFDGNGVMYITQMASDDVYRVYPDGRQEVAVQGIHHAYRIAFSPDGQMFVCTSNRGNSGIYRIQKDGTPELYVPEFAQALEGMAFDREGYLYVADGIQGIIYRIAPDRTVIPFTRNLSGPVDLAFGWGQYAKTLFATNMGLESSGYYYGQVIAVPTGRYGLPLPFGTQTSVSDWRLR